MVNWDCSMSPSWYDADACWMASMCGLQCLIHSAVTAFWERGVKGAFCRSVVGSGTTRVPGGVGGWGATSTALRASNWACRASMSMMGRWVEVVR
eukprot:1671192-Rhodomonas_salina.1